tara:strand:- start:321 stop:509 length:189 start_codon:yes stop_codon:yes gene_type:complete
MPYSLEKINKIHLYLGAINTSYQTKLKHTLTTMPSFVLLKKIKHLTEERKNVKIRQFGLEKI